MKKLWEVEHPYYCNQNNYFDNGCFEQCDSWASFVDENEDLDMNLVFRWDWELLIDKDGKPMPMNPDPYYRDGKLLIFYIGQRKGLFRSVEIAVCQADEPMIREWLLIRYEHLKKLWSPFNDQPS